MTKPNPHRANANHDTHLFHYARHRPSLEPNPRIPLAPEGHLHPSLKLRMARVRIRQLAHEVLGRLLVTFLRDDEVRLGVVCARRGCDAWDGLDQVGFGGTVFGAGAAPGALWGLRGM